VLQALENQRRGHSDFRFVVRDYGLFLTSPHDKYLPAVQFWKDSRKEPRTKLAEPWRFQAAPAHNRLLREHGGAGWSDDQAGAPESV